MSVVWKSSLLKVDVSEASLLVVVSIKCFNSSSSAINKPEVVVVLSSSLKLSMIWLKLKCESNKSGSSADEVVGASVSTSGTAVVVGGSAVVVVVFVVVRVGAFLVTVVVLAMTAGVL